MNNLTVQVSKLVGAPTDSSWSQIYTYFPEDPIKKQKRGTFLAALSFSRGEEEIEALAFGREILSRIHEEYYGETETPVMEKLTKAVKAVSEEFEMSLQGLELVAGVIFNDVLYLAIYGAGEIWIKRGSQMQDILSSAVESVENASGFIRANDLIILGTGSFFKVLPDGIFKAALDNEEPEEITEALAPLILGNQGSVSSACLVCRVKEESVEEIIEQAVPEMVISDVPVPAPRSLDSLVDHFPKVDIDRFINNAPPTESLHGKKVAFSLAIIIIFLLVISVFMGIKKRGGEQKNQSYQSLYGQIEQKLNEGKALITLNPLRSRELFLSAQEQLGELQKLQIKIPETSQLANLVADSLDLVIKEQKFSDVPLFYDLGMIIEKASGGRLGLSGNKLVVLDSGQNRLYAVDIEQKSGVLVAGTDLPTVVSLVTAEDNVAYVFGKNGIGKINIVNKAAEIIIKEDPEYGEIKAIGSFGSNLYLLDSVKNKIWRYQFLDTGFSTKQSWLKAETPPNFSNMISMTIDGSIWLLDRDGKIYKLIGGIQENFNLKGLDKPLSGATVIYTDQNAKNLYLLDRGNKRIIYFSKTGEYQGQLIWDGFSLANDFVVLEESKKVIVLQDNKIFQINFK